MECESCLEKEAEVDGLVDGEYKKLCKTCVILERAVVVPPASNKSIHDLYKRPTVREVLSRMSGVNRPAINSYSLPKKEVGLEDLRARSTTYKAPRRNFNDVNTAVPQIIAQSPAVQAAAIQSEGAEAASSEVVPEENKPGLFKKLFGFFGKKEKTPNPQEEPKVDMAAAQNERLNQARMAVNSNEVLEL